MSEHINSRDLGARRSIVLAQRSSSLSAAVFCLGEGIPQAAFWSGGPKKVFLSRDSRGPSRSEPLKAGREDVIDGQHGLSGPPGQGRLISNRFDNYD